MKILLFVILWLLCGFLAAVMMRCHEKKNSSTVYMDTEVIMSIMSCGPIALFVAIMQYVSDIKFSKKYLSDTVEYLADKCAGVKK